MFCLYTLETENLPLIRDSFKLPSNAETMFHAEVYFVNLTTQMGIKWGTDSKVRMFDPASGLHIELGACGSFNTSFFTILNIKYINLIIMFFTISSIHSK